jgi:Tfp pilus assembly protein PilX
MGKQCSGRNQRGIGIVVVMLAILVLTVLTAAIVVNSRREIYSSFNYRIDSQAAYVADAGLQKTLNWFRNSYSPASASSYNLNVSPVQTVTPAKPVKLESGAGANYPDPGTLTSFQTNVASQTVNAPTSPPLSGTIVVKAILQSARSVTAFTASGSGPTLLERWHVTSQGKVSGGIAEVSAVIERPSFPLFRYAAFATGSSCGALDFSAGGTINSYNSSQGTYTATKQNSNGNLGTNGNLAVSSPLTVKGSLSTPYGNTTGACGAASMTALSGSGATITEGLTNLIQPPSYPTPAAPSPAPPATNQDLASCASILGCTVMAAGNYSLATGTYGNLTDSNGGTVHFSGGTYNINSLSVQSGETFVVDSGQVTLSVAGSGVTGAVVSLASGTQINAGGNPSNFIIVYGGTGAIDLTAGVGFYGLVYAPNAPVSFQSGGDLYGGVVSNTLSSQSAFNIHYDRALLNGLRLVGPYNPASWSRGAR